MLRSRHLCCMAIHTEKNCEVRSFGDLGRMCPGGMAEMQITIWGHRLGFRCLAVFGVDGSQV